MIKKFINYGIGCCDMSDDSILEAVVESGFDGVFLYCESAGLKNIISKTIHANLEIQALHLPYKHNVNSLWDINRNSANKYIKGMLNYIRLAGSWGIKQVIMHITSGFTPPPFNMQGILRLRQLLHLCEKEKVYLSIENLKRIDYIYYVISNCNSPYLRICYDSGHANLYDNDHSLIEKYARYISCVHLNDNDGISDLHLVPFKGNISWNSLLHKLYSEKPQFPITLEIYRDGREQYYDDIGPQAILAEAYSSAEKIERLIFDHLRGF